MKDKSHEVSNMNQFLSKSQKQRLETIGTIEAQTKYNRFWVSGRKDSNRTVGCQICGKKIKQYKESYPVDAVLRNEYWINTLWFCFEHDEQDLISFFERHQNHFESGNAIYDNDILKEYNHEKQNNRVSEPLVK